MINAGDTVEIMETQRWAKYPVGHIGKVVEIVDGHLEGKPCKCYNISGDNNMDWAYPLHKLRKVEE